MKARTIDADVVRIGEAAEQLGVEAHVLRHWEDVGVVRPPRDPSGYRRFDEESLQRARMVQACQSAGMALDQIRIVLDSREAGRAAVIREQKARVARQLGELRRTERFLEHVLTCRHPLVSRCPECSAYPGSDPTE